ncbi:MAG: RNA methyltransferase [Planctomycetota bacterium]|jgi:tRNA (guanosine-2'-O-)-methyltransferase|nr:RNA methyltransferase [Planctomycetota bacterium]
MSLIEFVDEEPELEEETTLLPRRIARMREVAGRRLNSLALILDNLHDPHNISACMRSCDIFGIQNIHIVHPEGKVKLHRGVTRGCQRWLHIRQHATVRTCLEQVRNEGYMLLAADPNSESRNLEEIEFSSPTALILGAEHFGLSPEALEMADQCFHVQMHGFSQSFNVSVAAAISLHISSAARRKLLEQPGDLSEEEQAQLVQSWIDAHKERRKS